MGGAKLGTASQIDLLELARLYHPERLCRLKICGGACDTHIIEISVTKPHQFVMEMCLMSPLGKTSLHLSPIQETLGANGMHSFLQVLGARHPDT